jgi:hypothetical protein
MTWDEYVHAMRQWRLSPGGPKPRVAFQSGSHIDSLPVEANPPPLSAGVPVPASPATDPAEAREKSRLHRGHRG